MRLFHHKTTDEEYYSPAQIDKTKAVYRLIIGERSNGKTYSIIRKIIKHYFKYGVPSAYIRRYAEELKPANLNNLITPHAALIKKLSNGKYESFVYRSNAFTFCNYDENGKIIAKDTKPFLYTAALSTWEKSKGADRGQIKYFVFDEFLTRSKYLTNEFSKFANCHSSFARNREGVITYMLANTVNSESIYWQEMGIDNVEKMKQGDIYIYNYNNDKLTVAVEYCLHAKAKTNVEYYYAFDNPALEMIKTGSWETDKYPHLEDFSINEENIRFVFFLQFNDKLLKGNVVYDQRSNDYFVFFHKFGNSNYKLKPTDVLFTNCPTTNIFHFHSIGEAPLIKNEKLIRVLSIIALCFRNNKIFYSTNSVGEVVRNFMLNPYTAKGGN